MEYKKDRICSEFSRLDQRRQNKLQRAQDCARLTIPSLFPEDGFSETMDLPDIHSSLPARGVMALSSRLVSSIYPLDQTPFLTLELDQRLVPPGTDPTETMVELGRLDRKIMDRLSTTNLRESLFTLFQHLLVCGDALLECDDNYGYRVHRIDHYVVQRYPDGRVSRIILREWVDEDAIPPEWGIESKDLKAKGYGNSANAPSSGHIPYYTEVKWNPKGNNWKVEVEFNGNVVDTGTYDICPYFPQVWVRIAGEDYGRSMVEENIGDIRTLESITKSLTEAAAANAEFRIGVDPTGITEVSDIQGSENGDFIPARVNDVFAIQLLKQIDISPMAVVRQDLSASLAKTFLMQSAIQRTGDRVTATEIREVAQELDQSLGGIFSGKARDIQIPIVLRVMVLMARDKIIPPELTKVVTSGGGLLNLKIRTGLEALNREVTHSKLVQWAQVVGQSEAVQGFVDWYGWALRFTSSFGLEPQGLVKSPDQLQSEQQQQAQQSISAMTAEQMVSSMGTMAEQGSAAALEQQTQQQATK